ncbi:MAG: putative glycoside hydrolase [Clostridia bacterium]|jgi:xylan 1,4-beta-xylosidase|nr:putative glycoside hydrolase [Clostridia bacterium]
MLKNPILTGFNPDPCICKKGDDYYIAVSSFEWFPGVPVYHSKDLKNWRLLTHCLNDEALLDLRRLPSAKGIWAPCLTWCEEDGLFYLVYGIMNSMNADFFDIDNYVITTPDLCGQWSEPVYLHSAGFDASLFHDDDGRKWLTSLEWEFREGYEKPGVICITEYDAKAKKVIGKPKRIWGGGTDRGCIEGPHIYKRKGMYYIMCAEGGTGYGHSVTMGRSHRVDGDYVKDPENPILTSTAVDFNERHDSWFLKPHYYNPDSVLQKSGHGSLVETPDGEVYLVHHSGRPFKPELRCTLGRETCIQKMYWTEDGWLRLEGGGNLAKEYVDESKLPEHKWENTSIREDFDDPVLPMNLYTLRISPSSFTSLTARKGYLRIRGQESLSSLNRVSLIAHKLTSVKAQITTKMVFHPEVYQHSAGLVIFYDNMNYIYLRQYYSDTLGAPALGILQVENGERTEYLKDRIDVSQYKELFLRVSVEGRRIGFMWSPDGKDYQKIAPYFDTSLLSDEYCKYGEFTGTFVGICCIDSLFHTQYADFDMFEYISDDAVSI